ncbi:hypothetical protein MYCTH_2308285 [Thermothelomyces thermophilus ATCC 42464]|uniref:Uncharacterized protein n=1 Tax=Thermothelomyces thermophilus (strain ATCC 42464 / BCRC 31852 / DSM 1799) TaxID=573729 RepID=G2QJK8_THET4|nr:uncharacterized protein MYCTH_2308285 [Thermothelomyces thermophilus ATCC 42464]AEO59765.1 hypothetical protein MYCTH_2308285 [Thermothelomyces thermophilus ATCC 42464]
MPRNWTCLQTLEGHTRAVYSIAWSHDATKLASAVDFDTFGPWITRQGEERLRLPPEYRPSSAAIIIWDLDSHRLCFRPHLVSSVRRQQSYRVAALSVSY